MFMKTNVIVKLQVEGLHFWPAAKDILPEVAFLSNQHRHVFHMTLKKAVHHDDRDIEFIMFKRDVTEYLHDKYYNPSDRCHVFGARSCEMIARELLEHFECRYVSVFEDDENGAEVEVEHL